MSKIQEIFRLFYSQYSKNYTLSRQQSKTATEIINCRTSKLGGRKYQCGKCGHSIIQYNSCRNRHCPTCQSVKKEVWVDQRQKDILNAPYFHVVFTMPEQLHMIIYHNQKLLYDLMYKTVAETLLELAADQKYLGAQIGFFSVLHTWGQNLHYHPHIHSAVLAGGLSDQKTWKKASEKFFIPVRVLSKKFRGKFLYYLKRYYKQGKLNFYNDSEKFRNRNQFQKLINQCYSIDWYSYTKRTFAGPLAVVKYLGNYVHRIAITNQRILSINQDSITIKVKDYKNIQKRKTVTMKPTEFIRRFLMHVLPKRFVKIRHYGLLANRNKNTKLALCRKLSRSPSYKPKFEGKSTLEVVSTLLNKDILLCPECKQTHLLEVNSWKAVP